MGMRTALDVLNRMVKAGVITRYALAGAVAAYNYIEPTVTDDLDILVALDTPGGRTGLITLTPLFEYLRTAGYSEFRHEGILIGDWTVQFLPVAGPLDEEALATAEHIEVTLEGSSVSTWVIRAEYLVAAALKVGRPKDQARMIQFIEERAVDIGLLCPVLARFNLIASWQRFCARMTIDDPCGKQAQ